MKLESANICRSHSFINSEREIYYQKQNIQVIIGPAQTNKDMSHKLLSVVISLELSGIPDFIQLNVQTENYSN